MTGPWKPIPQKTLAAGLFIALLLALWSAASASAEDGLPPGVSVPAWAVGKQIHFDAAESVSGTPNSSLAGPEPLVEEETPMNYFGGSTEVEPKLFLIFWGKNWNGEGAELKKEFLKFYEYLKESPPYQKILSQYDSPGGHISTQPEIESIVEDGSVSAPTNVGESAVIKEAEKEREIAGSKKNQDYQYVVLLPPGTTYEKGFGENFCAYHAPLGAKGIYGSYDFVPYEGSPPFDEAPEGFLPCTYYGEGKYDANYATTGAASHEYAESATDPYPDSGWATKENAEKKIVEGKEVTIEPEELADVCKKKGKHQLPNGIWVAELWDNTKKGCEIADESPVLQEIGPYTAPEYEAALFVTPDSAQLDGGIEPCGLEAHYYFEYGPTTSYGTNTTEGTLPSGYWGPLQEPAEITGGLKPNTLYHWRVVVKTSHGTEKGADHTFTTPYYPVVQSKPATSVRATRATLNGTVNPEGAETKYYFEYGTTKSYGSKTAEASAGSGTAGVEESAAITGLGPSTTYHFRLVASNAGGTEYGSDEVLTTPASSKPYVETKAATGAGENGATLNGVVNPENAETKYYFEYGTTESYGEKTAETSAGAGTSNVEESKAITGLSASTTYHFRIVATNSNGTTDGADQVLSTTGKPSAETWSATKLGSTEATLNGGVNPRGTATKYYFEYGLTTSYGTKTTEASAGSGTTNVGENAAITGLTMSTKYHFRIVAVNSHGTTDGSDQTFTTTAPEWWVKKGGVFKAVTEPVKFTIEGNYELKDIKYPGGGLYEFGVSCRATGEGELKSGGKGLMTYFAGVSSEEGCAPIKVEKGKYDECERVEKQYIIDLPWATELYTASGEARQRIESSGSGTPYWGFRCKAAVGGVIAEECGVNTSTHMTNNASSGLVEAGFDAKSSKTKCTEGGSEAGEWKGTLKIKATSKEVEAIKVE